MTELCERKRQRGAGPGRMLFGLAAVVGLLLASPNAGGADPAETGSGFELVKGAPDLEALADAELAGIRGGSLSADANASNRPRRKVILWDEARRSPAPVASPDPHNTVDIRSCPESRSRIAIVR
jgi:hypothetical protein